MKSLELIKEAKTGVFEVTTSNPSVYSEIGIALALLKPSIMLWNIEERPFDYQQIVDFLRSIKSFSIREQEGLIG
jgi:nucleoside 2-deoxyribosyltransferase